MTDPLRAPAGQRLPWVALVVYALLGLALLGGYVHQINPDGTAYLSAARKYAALRFLDAATGFWSPLYTWLLTVAIACRVPPLAAAKLIDLGSGLLALAGAWRLLCALDVPRGLRVAGALTLVPVLLGFALTVVSPDLLACAVALHFLAALCGEPWWTRPRAGLRLGLWMGLCYLAKAYALGFVVVLFTLVTGLDLWRTPAERRRIALAGAGAALTLAVIVAAWASVLGVKYGRPMASSAGTLNWGFDGPGTPGYPMQRDGFLALPDPLALSAWDDPTFLSLPTWNAFGSPAERAHFRWLIRRNLGDLSAILTRFSVLGGVVLALSAVLATSRLDPPPRRPVALLLLASAVYPSAYVVLHLRERYVCLLAVLLLVLGAFVLGALDGWLGGGRSWRMRLAAALLFSSFLASPVGALRTAWGEGRQWAEIAPSFAPAPPGARVASNGRWRQSLYLSFHRGWRYLGEPRPDATSDVVERELRRHGAEYFLVWGDPRTVPFVAAWPEVARAPGAPPRLYRVPALATESSAPVAR